MAAFTGGDKLEKRLKEIAQKLGSAKSVRVGFLENATYPNGQSVAEVAAYAEYGTSKSPPRPFFSQMIARYKGGWGKKVGNLLKLNNYDTARTLGLFGEGVKGQLQQSIIDFTDPQDSDATKARKNFKYPDSSTLIESGHMLNSADWEVVK